MLKIWLTKGLLFEFLNKPISLEIVQQSPSCYFNYKCPDLQMLPQFVAVCHVCVSCVEIPSCIVESEKFP